MAEADVVTLTQALVRANSVNPPGDEAETATLVAKRLEGSGFRVEHHSFGAERYNLIADLPGSLSAETPLVLTGHLDTVPLGSAPWRQDPFGGEIDGGRLYGRGASDMKAGIAAMTLAAIRAAAGNRLRRGLRLIFTGGEETGCQGALALRADGILGAASGIVVGEPTANRIALGHKGCLCVQATARGVTAHSSMPHLGRNAIYRAAEAVLAARDLDLSFGASLSLGEPSLNIGTIAGGLNFNSVPDHASFTVDIRTTETTPHSRLLASLSAAIGSDMTIEQLVDMPAVLTSGSDAFVSAVARAVERVLGAGSGNPRVPMPFFTDASVMQPATGAPVVILGPGEPDMAHQTDEYCNVARIEEAVAIYEGIIAGWCD